LVLQLLHLLQLLEALELQLPAQLVLASDLGLLQLLQHLEVLGLQQPPRLLLQLLEALDQQQEQNRLHLEALELLAQLALVQALQPVLELEPQQVLEHLQQPPHQHLEVLELPQQQLPQQHQP